MRLPAAVVVCVLFAAGPTSGAVPPVPEDFPRFEVPGHEKAMSSLRELYWLHYHACPGPLATLWDEWMVAPTVWPAVQDQDRQGQMRQRWARALLTRHIDAEGYVSTHQHPSIAHPDGWPFPFWAQGGEGAWGWHFAIPGLHFTWHGTVPKTQEGWALSGAVDRGIADHCWNIELTAADAAVEPPPLLILPLHAPFMQLRWRARGLGHAQPFLEWATETEPAYGPQRRMYFTPAADDAGMVYTLIPTHRSPAWQGRITRLRIRLGNPAPGATVGIQALFTTYDTRHSVNNLAYIRGCCEYFDWTRDLNFLRAGYGRIRQALAFVMDQLGGREHRCIVVPWVGHDGRSGVVIGPEGDKQIRPGHGIGHNYWDLLPMGQKDSYATIRYYEVLKRLAALEEQAEAHPEWNLPRLSGRGTAEDLRAHAEEVKAHAGRLFWNDRTGRFHAGIDADGRAWDYGYTFLNAEAVYYDLAGPTQAEAILDWLEGKRVVEDDTARGPDIYFWRFAPRASTRRNVEWYGWFWSHPESIPWGGQVQDGGAVLGWSFHDLMARLKVRGPDNAWRRLGEILAWFEEVQAAGGYRAYYQDGSRGTLQGGGTAGGLGLDQEFFESILVPQVVIEGFLGFRPLPDGCRIDPRLPADWPELTVTGIGLHDLILEITARPGRIALTARRGSEEVMTIRLPAGAWRQTVTGPDGRPAGGETVLVEPGPAPQARLVLSTGTRAIFELR